MSIRTAVVAILAAATIAGGPAPAQGINLPPDVYGALSELHQAATFRCQAGFPEACNYIGAIESYAGQLSNAFYWCQMNDPSACQYYQQGVQEVAYSYQQYQAGLAAEGYPRTPQQHQQIMQQNQQAFDTYQQGYQAQQQANDDAHRRFIQSIWE